MSTRRVGFVIGSIAASALVLACTGEFYDTVYFNSPDVDWGVPPSPMLISSWDERSPRSNPYYNQRYEVDNDIYTREEKATNLDARLFADLSKQNYRAAQVTAKAQFDFTRGKVERYRLLSEATQMASAKPSADWARFFAGYRKETAKPGSGLGDLAAVKSPVVLPFALYVRADSELDAAKAAALFGQAARLGGPRKLPATVMAARKGMEAAYPFQSNPVAKYQPIGLAATSRFESIVKNPAATRFHWNAQHWLVRPLFANKKYDQAALKYLRLVGTATQDSDKLSALSSFRKSYLRLSPAQAKSFRAGVLADQTLAEEYLAFRLYHFYRSWEDESPKADMKALNALANEVTDRYPQLRPELAARVAEIAFLSKDYQRAVVMARGVPTTAKGADLATYVLAASLEKQGKQADAMKLLATFESRFPKSYLKNSAIEYRTTQHIRNKDLNLALEDFEKLGYRMDVAYLLDVRMLPEEVHFVAKSEKSKPEAEKYMLAAGYRYLRKGNYSEAEQFFAAIPEARRKKLAEVGERNYAWLQDDGLLDSIPDPLQTTRELKALEAKISTATGSAKAAAKYELASYFYNRRNLLLYNASLWKGGRGVLVGLNTGVADDWDKKAVTEHCFEHEALAQARKICLEISAEFPKESVSAKALYRAATATRRLADFNGWWRYETGATYYTSAADLLKRVYSEFPSSELAANAKKYESVYREEGKDTVVSTMFSTPR